MQKRQEMRGQEDPLEEEVATHSSILAWRILWTEEPGRLLSMGSQRDRHDWATEHVHALLRGIKRRSEIWISFRHGSGSIFQVKFQKMVLIHEALFQQLIYRKHAAFPRFFVMAQNLCCWQPGMFPGSSLPAESAPSDGSAEPEFGKL